MLDDRNKFLPRIDELYDIEVRKRKVKKQYIVTHTKADIFASIFTILMMAGGICSWYKLAEIYRDYELTNYGTITKGKIIDTG